jgi:hypothetical protein
VWNVLLHVTIHTQRTTTVEMRAKTIQQVIICCFLPIFLPPRIFTKMLAIFQIPPIFLCAGSNQRLVNILKQQTPQKDQTEHCLRKAPGYFTWDVTPGASGPNVHCRKFFHSPLHMLSFDLFFS